MKVLRAVGWIVWIMAGLSALGYYTYNIKSLRQFNIELRKSYK